VLVAVEHTNPLIRIESPIEQKRKDVRAVVSNGNAKESTLVLNRVREGAFRVART
jgi:hypothetical protein